MTRGLIVALTLASAASAGVGALWAKHYPEIFWIVLGCAVVVFGAGYIITRVSNLMDGG